MDNTEPVKEPLPSTDNEEPEPTNSDEKKEVVKAEEPSSEEVDLKKDEIDGSSCLWDKYKYILLLLILVIAGYVIYTFFFKEQSPFGSSCDFGISVTNTKPAEPFYDTVKTVATKATGSV